MNSPGARTKKWLILGVSLSHLVESRDLFCLEAEVTGKIFLTGCTEQYAADKKFCWHVSGHKGFDHSKNSQNKNLKLKILAK